MNAQLNYIIAGNASPTCNATPTVRGSHTTPARNAKRAARTRSLG
jgi:hypothetical protein